MYTGRRVSAAAAQTPVLAQNFNLGEPYVHWHEFCSRNSPQYNGVPTRAILVARCQGDAYGTPVRE